GWRATDGPAVNVTGKQFSPKPAPGERAVVVERFYQLAVHLALETRQLGFAETWCGDALPEQRHETLLRARDDGAVKAHRRGDDVRAERCSQTVDDAVVVAGFSAARIAAQQAHQHL